MSDISDKTALVVDGGLFLPLADRLSREFGLVLLYVPGTEKPFPLLNDAIIGEGFPSFVRVHDLWRAIRFEADIVIFPDVGHSDLQEVIADEFELPVWGSRNGDLIELNREYLKKFQAREGMEVPPHEVIEGLDALRDYLAVNDDVYVKISRYRGLGETFHSVNYELSKPWLDAMAVKLGPMQAEMVFLVEHSIPAAAELGFDGYCIDGMFPDVAVQGIEAKDKGYIGVVRPYADLPKEIQTVNEQLQGFLKGAQYRNFFSTEVRLAEDGTPYLIDPCCRHASPAGECLHELIGNLGEVIWAGAHGEMIQPEYVAKFAAQAMIDHPGDETQWRVVDLPEGTHQWAKIYFACQQDGKICLPPFPWNHDTIGSVVGIGDTMEEAIESVKDTAAKLSEQGLTIHVEALADVLEEIESSEEAGAEVSDESIPDPATVKE